MGERGGVRGSPRPLQALSRFRPRPLNCSDPARGEEPLYGGRSRSRGSRGLLSASLDGADAPSRWPINTSPSRPDTIASGVKSASRPGVVLSIAGEQLSVESADHPPPPLETPLARTKL